MYLNYTKQNHSAQKFKTEFQIIFQLSFQQFLTAEEALNNIVHYACIVNNSTFMRNHGLESGGVIYVQGRSVYIENSNFIRNLGGFGGAVRGCQNATINVKGTTFKNDRAFIGAAIAVEFSVILSMDQIRYDYNDYWNLTGTAFRLGSY